MRRRGTDCCSSSARLQDGFPFTVVQADDNTVWIDGGIVRGLTLDTLLHAYPAEALDPVGAGEPLAMLPRSGAGSAAKPGVSLKATQ